MNKIVLVIVGLMMATDLSFAQNNVSVFSEDGLPFYLVLNGIRQNETAETNVRLEGLSAEYYAGKVIFNDGTLGAIEKKFFYVTGAECNPCDVTYKIKYDKKGNLVMKPFAFNSLATAPPPPPNVKVVQYNTTPMPQPVVSMQVTETTTTQTMGSSEGINMGVNMNGMNMGVNVNGVNMGVNVNMNDGFGNTSYSSTTTTTTTVVQTQPVVQSPPVVQEVVCPQMTGGSYSALMNSMDDKSFDDDKLVIAKQAARSNCLTVLQIKGIMNAMSWDEGKLDFAKYAYDNCLDRQNYYQVNDAFEWSSSIDDLDAYMGTR
ncbi:MAG: DUF4476 domain-containing protein [Chitinophagales bacterium]|nr:DUF4476 domain-containing protein [Chitinophagales bacterium]